MAKSTRVTVPKGTGEIVITPGSGEPLHLREVDGFIEVPDTHLNLVLAHVAEASIAKPAPAAPAKEK
jgi:hypothetical protein